jgi:hypothetical protein
VARQACLRLKQQDVYIGFRKREALQDILEACFLKKGRQVSKNGGFCLLPEINNEKSWLSEKARTPLS